MEKGEKFGIFKYEEGFAEIEESKLCLERLLSDIDDIPDDLVAEGDYKCRKNWWQGVIQELESILISRTLDNDTHTEIYEFINQYTSEEFKKKERIAREDINRANDIIHKIIARIETRKHLL